MRLSPDVEILPQITPNICRIQTVKFTQNFLAALISHFWNLNFNLYKLVSTLACPQRGSAFASDPQLLPALCAGRNSNCCRPVNGWNLYLGSQRSFDDANRDSYIEIVAFTIEEWVRFNISQDVQVARRSAVGSCIAFSWHSDTRTRVNSRRYSHIKGLWFADMPCPAAGRAEVLLPPRAATLLASHGKAHRTGCSLGLAASAAG